METFFPDLINFQKKSFKRKIKFQGPFRHYVLNVLWIFINLLCVLLTMYHLYKLYKDFSKSNFEAVRVASLVTTLISVNQVRFEFRAPAEASKFDIRSLQLAFLFIKVQSRLRKFNKLNEKCHNLQI